MCNRAVHIVFFFNDTATTEIYTLSLHDALPISVGRARDHEAAVAVPQEHDVAQVLELQQIDHVRYVGLEIDLRRSEMHPLAETGKGERVGVVSGISQPPGDGLPAPSPQPSVADQHVSCHQKYLLISSGYKIICPRLVAT